MKKRRTKLRRFLLRTLLFLLLTTGIAAVLLRSRTVQTLIAQKAATWLSKEIGAKVKVQALEFDFFRNIHLEGVYMEDKHGDTMIASDVLDLEYKSYDGDKRRIDFLSVTFLRANIHIGYHKKDKDKNIDFLIEYINGPKTKSTGPKKYWTVFFKNATIKDSRFVNFDEGEKNTEPGILDEYNLQFNKIQADIKNLWVIDDSLNFECRRLQTKERSGLNIRDFKGLCNIHYKGMDFENVEMKTNCSVLKGDLHFKYPGYKYLDKFVSNTTWNCSLRSSDICLADLSIFDHSLDNHQESLNLRRVKISGTYDHMRLTGLDVSWGNNSIVQGNFYLEGLPKWRTTYCDFEIPRLHTNADDISRLLKGMELPEMLHQAGNLEANGHFTGRFLDFNWDGTINSAFGNLTTNVLMDLSHGLNAAEFGGHFQSDGLDLGIINQELGISSFDMELNGNSLDPEKFNLDIESTLPQVVIRGQTFEQTRIKGNLTARNFTGSASFDDPRLNTGFDGTIDFTGKLPVFRFNAYTQGLDLFALNLDTTHTLIWGKYDINAEGSSPDEMTGYAYLDDVSIHRNGVVYQIAHEELSKAGRGKQTRIEMKGDLLKGFVEGRLSLANLQAIAVNSISDIFPDRIKPMPYNGKDSFRFDLSMPNTSLLWAYLMPGVETSAIALRGDYAQSLQQAGFELDPLDVQYGKFKFTNLDATGHLDSTTGLKFRISSALMENEGKSQFRNLNMEGTANEGCADYNLKLTDRSGLYQIDLTARSEVFRDSITIFPANSKVVLANEIWQISNDSRITYLNDGSILCKDLYLDGKDHYVNANGVISERNQDTLLIDFGNFRFDDLSPFLTESSLDSLEGKLNGSVMVTGLLGNPHFTGDIAARNLRYYSTDFGDANFSMHDIEDSRRIGVDCEFRRGLLRGLKVNGSVGYDAEPGKEQLALLVDIPEHTKLVAMQPFLVDILTINQGELAAQFSITGNLDKPVVKGEATVRNAAVKIDYLNTNYVFNADFVSDKKGFHTLKPALLLDENGTGTAKVSMLISHKNFSEFAMDLRIDSAKNLKVLNTNKKQNDLFYGTAWADGNCWIHGPFDQIDMDIYLRSKKNSKISLLYSDVEENEIMGFVTFDGNEKDTVAKGTTSSALHRIDIDIDATPELEAEFVIDQQTGDIIKGTGAGSIRMLYDENNDFYLFGTYVVEAGDYSFSIPGINVFTRTISMKKGGTITWAGDPYNAVVNMTGSFTKSISPAALMAATTGSSQKSYAPIRVESSLYMQGNLFSPDISFDIHAPDLEASGGGGANNEVFRVIQQIRADKDETMRQAVGLLLIGNFITPSFAQGSSSGGVVSTSGVAGNSLSGIASSVLNDIFARLGIPTRIQVKIDDIRTNAGKTNTVVFVNSEWFLTERIRLDLNYDPTVGIKVNESTALPLNFNLEYMTRNENWRIKAFSRSSNLLLQQTTSPGAAISSVSGNTIGAGVVYRREFDTFRRKEKTMDSLDRVKKQPKPVQKDSLPPT